jgi:hypothetical protein
VGSGGKRASHDESSAWQMDYRARCAVEDRALSLITRRRHV